MPSRHISKSALLAMLGWSAAVACGGRSGELFEANATSDTGFGGNGSGGDTTTDGPGMTGSNSRGAMGVTTSTTGVTPSGVVGMSGVGGGMFGGTGVTGGMFGGTVGGMFGPSVTSTSSTGVDAGGATNSDTSTNSSTISTTGVGGGPATTTGGVEPNPVECVSCAIQECPFFVDCFQDVDCARGLACTARQCANATFECIVECHDGDAERATNLLVGFLCLTGACGDLCGLEQ